MQNADFAFRVSDDGIAGAVQNATLLGPDFGGDVTLTGTVSVLVNTTTFGQTVEVDGTDVTVSAADVGGFFLRVEVAGGALVVLGNTFSAQSLAFERDGNEVIVSGEAVDFEVKAGTKRIIRLDDADLSSANLRGID